MTRPPVTGAVAELVKQFDRLWPDCGRADYLNQVNVQIGALANVIIMLCMTSGRCT